MRFFLPYFKPDPYSDARYQNWSQLPRRFVQCSFSIVVSFTGFRQSPFFTFSLQSPFLVNDVTKVTSWLMSSRLKNRSFRYTVSFLNLPGGVFCEMLGGDVPAGH